MSHNSSSDLPECSIPKMSRLSIWKYYYSMWILVKAISFSRPNQLVFQVLIQVIQHLACNRIRSLVYVCKSRVVRNSINNDDFVAIAIVVLTPQIVSIWTNQLYAPFIAARRRSPPKCTKYSSQNELIQWFLHANTKSIRSYLDLDGDPDILSLILYYLIYILEKTSK